MLEAAEEVIPLTGKITMVYGIERRFASYMGEVFQADVNMSSDISIWQFLFSYMIDTKYFSRQYRRWNIEMFYFDFIKFYGKMNSNRFNELWKMNIFLGKENLNFYEACLLSLFFNIPASKLASMMLKQNFGREMYILYEKKLRHINIEIRPSELYSLMKTINIPVQNFQNILSQDLEVHNWEKIDADILPLIPKIIQYLKGDEFTGPRKITMNIVLKMLQISDRSIFRLLPQCYKEIEKNKETTEQYQINKIIWAINQIKFSEQDVTLDRIMELTKIKPKIFKYLLPKIMDSIDNKLAEEIRHLV